MSWRRASCPHHRTAARLLNGGVPVAGTGRPRKPRGDPHRSAGVAPTTVSLSPVRCTGSRIADVHEADDAAEWQATSGQLLWGCKGAVAAFVLPRRTCAPVIVFPFGFLFFGFKCGCGDRLRGGTGVNRVWHWQEAGRLQPAAGRELKSLASFLTEFMPPATGAKYSTNVLSCQVAEVAGRAVLWCVSMRALGACG